MSTGDTAGIDDEFVANRPEVTANRTSTDRTVFTEHGNTEAWIATDLTVELEP